MSEYPWTPDKVTTEAPCRYCGGEGSVDSSEDVGPTGMVTCHRCSGTGRVFAIVTEWVTS